MGKRLLIFSLVLGALGAGESNAAYTKVIRQNDRIILQGFSCDQVVEITHSLMDWTRSTGVEKACPIDSTPPTRKGAFCQFDITDCVPDHVAKYEGIQPKVGGPNCYNVSLVMKGILPNLRHTPPDEMDFYMRPPLCTQLKDGESKMPGDVGVIREISGGEVLDSHGFVYISDQIAYSRNGFYDVPYSLDPLDAVLRAYKVPAREECRKNEINLDAGCPSAVSYFRCISMGQYLKEHPGVPAKLLDSLRNVSAFEGCLESAVMEGEVLTESAKKGMRDTAKALLTYLKKEIESEAGKGADTESDFVLGSLQLRLEGIAWQLVNMENENERKPLSETLSFIASSMSELQKKKK